MFLWKQFRIWLLALTFGSSILVLGKVILLPHLDKSKETAFVFPEKVPLPQWQLSATIALEQPTVEHPELIAHQHYRFIENDLTLDIEMRYLHNLYNADVNSLIHSYTNRPSSAIVRQREGVGYYGLGVDKKRAYLSACINPRGGSTFTHIQFRRNRYLEDVRLERLVPVLQNQELLLDKRCLWAHFSVPLQNSSTDAAYQILEKAWFSWYQWWRPRFPKP